ncbi:sulfatase [Legionella jordanis]|uniref:sulfatase-like hydrolase/transferase n=1 Tax=Legionella jordanis TaxID=456 RepID=UPI000EFF8FE4|nr:sulfatase-like hydrolase/transferase [Legionella jordanis]RMX17965.1 sulfatase [Legionella jordanis]
MKYYVHSYFLNFAWFNAFFLSLQFIFILSQTGSFMNAVHLPASVYGEIAFAVLMQIVLYFLLCLVQSIWFWGIRNYFKSLSLAQIQAGIFFITVLALTSLNCHFFPMSWFSRLFLPECPSLLIKTVLFLSLAAIFLLSINALFKSLILYRAHSLAAIGAIAAFTVLILHEAKAKAHDKAKATLANVIFIGVDSLSAQYINPNLTPNIYKFAKDSTAFRETITPLARTFPAWTSILTGDYPLHHGARYNLMPSDEVNKNGSLAWVLKNKGYETIYVTDDRQFSKISYDFGFDHILGPKAGVNDFLLGTFYDFPLSNLLINFKISHWLFPYNHLNRASYFSYYPTSLHNALLDAIKTRTTQAPLFLAVHFTLPHWPYVWASSSPAGITNDFSFYEREDLYLKAIHEADTQVGRTLDSLEKEGYLNNSLLLILSDHGEAIYRKGSRAIDRKKYQGNDPEHLADYFRRKTTTTLETSVGHGSDLLSPSQFHSLLYFKIFKNSQLLNRKQVIDERASLIDIAPTILSFLNIRSSKSFDGISLLHAILNGKTLPSRAIFMESGALPNYLVSEKNLTQLAKLMYQVNPKNNWLEIRKDRIPLFDAMKLYAILEGDWLLALYPDDYQYISILLNTRSGQWSDDMNSSFARHSPATGLLQNLLSFYGKELAAYPKSRMRPHLLEESLNGFIFQNR